MEIASFFCKAKPVFFSPAEKLRTRNMLIKNGFLPAVAKKCRVALNHESLERE